MKRIVVNAYEKALVFKNGRLVNVLSEGSHWLGWGHKVEIKDVTAPFYHQMDLDLLLDNKVFASMVDTKIVKDSEILIQYKDGNAHRVLTTGRYCFWKEGLKYTYNLVDLNEINVNVDLKRSVLQNPLVRKYLTIYSIESYEKGLLYIDGKLVKQLTPGVYYYWKGDKPSIVKKIDLRIQQIEISGQELLTKDKAAIRVNFHATYKVMDIIKALDETLDYSRKLYLLLQLGIREHIGQHTLDELLSNKTAIGPYIMGYVKDKGLEMGVELKSCGMRDIILPGDVKEIMNQVLIAEKKAQANVIMRREETASTRSLLNTAKLMEDNEMLFRLKEMEYMEKISEKIGEITVNGNSQVLDQLRGLVISK